MRRDEGVTPSTTQDPFSGIVCACLPRTMSKIIGKRKIRRVIDLQRYAAIDPNTTGEREGYPNTPDRRPRPARFRQKIYFFPNHRRKRIEYYLRRLSSKKK